MKIEKIIYNTTRGLTHVQEKLDIATIVLFSYKYDDKDFAELLYCENKEQFIRNLEAKINLEGIKWNIDFTRSEVRQAFKNTLEEVKKQYDDLGYYKALYEGDGFAKVTYEVSKAFYPMRERLNDIMNFKTQL